MRDSDRVADLPETVESGDDVQPVVDCLRRLLPGVAEVRIDRRDRAMARRLDALSRVGHDVLAVVGVGHHNGIVAARAELEGGAAVPEVDVPVRSATPEEVVIPVE